MLFLRGQQHAYHITCPAIFFSSFLIYRRNAKKVRRVVRYCESCFLCPSSTFRVIILQSTSVDCFPQFSSGAHEEERNVVSLVGLIKSEKDGGTRIKILTARRSRAKSTATCKKSMCKDSMPHSPGRSHTPAQTTATGDNEDRRKNAAGFPVPELEMKRKKRRGKTPWPVLPLR